MTKGGWTLSTKLIGGGRAVILSDNKDGSYYWTHRPGNTPEKQAAFDAAVEAWLQEAGDHPHPLAKALADTAKALGYGKR